MIRTFGLLFVTTNSLALGLNLHIGQMLAHFTFGTRPLVSVAVLSINILGIVILLLVGMEWGRAQARKGAVADTSVASSSTYA